MRDAEKIVVAQKCQTPSCWANNRRSGRGIQPICKKRFEEPDEARKDSQFVVGTTRKVELALNHG
jgi:hypothetical protein